MPDTPSASVAPHAEPPLSQRVWRQHARLSPATIACWLAMPGEALAPLSRSAMMARVDAWQEWLAHQPGSRPGARWVLFQPTTLGACVQLLALWECGMIAILPGDERPETLARLADTSAGQLPPTTADGWPLQQLRQKDSPQRAIRSCTSLTTDHIALELCTSGSTGEPLRIPKRFDQLEAELCVHQTLWPLATGTSDTVISDTVISDTALPDTDFSNTATHPVCISQVSHQHIYGLLVSLLRPICEGVPFLSKTCHYPEQLSAAITQLSRLGYHCQLASSPAQLARLPDGFNAREGQVLRTFSSGAPLINDSALHAEKILHAPVIEIYGSTETGGIAQRRQQESRDWTPLPGVELAFSPAFAVRSPFLEQREHWWQQADNAAVVGDTSITPSRFQLLGRSDRLVKLAGKRISLSAVERSLGELSDVLAVRCLPMPTRDHRLGAVVVMSGESLPKDHASRRALISRLRRTLMPSFERIALPRYWRFVSRLPLNAQGKFTAEAVSLLFADLDDRRLPRWLGEHSSSPDKRTLEAEVPDTLIYLEGHFSVQPVVPGVVMLKWARDLGHKLRLDGTGIDEAHFQRLERIKFSTLLLPGMRFTLACTLTSDSQGLRVDFLLESSAGLHCSGRLRYTPEGGVPGHHPLDDGTSEVAS